MQTGNRESAAPTTLAALAACDDASFVAQLDGVFEHAPWVARAALASRPHTSGDALHAAMMEALHALPEPALIALLCGHPELAGAQARAGTMTAESVAEQGALALGSVDANAAARWGALNARYRERFGFPFILCIRRHTRGSALRVFEQRLTHDRATELQASLAEIGRISRLRLAARIADHGMGGLHGKLSTHVLDIGRGHPAPGMRVELHEVGAEGRCLVDTVTDAGGATRSALIEGAPLRIGRYELRFHVGAYFASSGSLATGRMPGPTPLAEPVSERFLDVVPVAFGIDDPEGDYHLPLAVTPWAYSTYRGH